jgi:hypothetical protein
MKTIHVPGGILHISESRALCPACKIHQPIEKLEPKWEKVKGFSMRHKCACGYWMHITTDIRGDFVAYKTGKL